MSVLTFYTFRLVHTSLKRLAGLFRKDKEFYGLVILFVLLTSLLVLGLTFSEFRLRRLGYYPGSLNRWSDFSMDNPNITMEITANERGMTYFDPDSFPRAGYPSRFVVNKQGFPSPFNFDRATIDSLSGIGQSKKNKKLILGDSFIEGIGASNFDKSFMEIYRKRNPSQIVCLTGIRGMDPVQYRLCAEKFIPEIRPDEVCVMFCSWNDVLLSDRKPVPFIPLFSDIKGVGIISNYIPPGIAGQDTMAMPPVQAYQLYRKHYSLTEKKDLLSKLCKTSSVSTRLYSIFHRQNNNLYTISMDSGSTYRNLKKIKDLTDSMRIKFTIIFIPTPYMKNYSIKDYEKHFKWVFGDLWSYVHLCPKGMITPDDCISDIDYHFNDRGQVKFADFLQRELSSP